MLAHAHITRKLVSPARPPGHPSQYASGQKVARPSSQQRNRLEDVHLFQRERFKGWTVRRVEYTGKASTPGGGAGTPTMPGTPLGSRGLQGLPPRQAPRASFTIYDRSCRCVRMLEDKQQQHVSVYFSLLLPVSLKQTLALRGPLPRTLARFQTYADLTQPAQSRPA